MSTFNCNYGHIFTKKYYNIHVKTYDAQLIGAANIIKQHLTKTLCYAAIDTTLHVGYCILQDYPNHIAWIDPQHKQHEMNTLGVYENQRQRNPKSSYRLCV